MAKFDVNTLIREELVEAADRKPEAAKDQEITPEKAAELGRNFVDLVQQQTKHNLCMMLAMAQARHWNEVIEIQQDYLRTSMALMAKIANSSVAMLQSVVTTSAQDEAKRPR